MYSQVSHSESTTEDFIISPEENSSEFLPVSSPPAKHAIHKLASPTVYVPTQSKPSGEPVLGTDGIRGQVGQLITPQLFYELGFITGKQLPDGPILIGRDSRSGGVELMKAATAGLAKAGRDVWALGLCPTAAIQDIIKREQVAGGLIVSASHNPPNYNGLKVFGHNGEKLGGEPLENINNSLRVEAKESYLCSKFAVQDPGKVHKRPDLLLNYRQALLDSVEGLHLQYCKVVLDLCWGSATACGCEVFRDLGADVNVLHPLPNGREINKGCGTTNLKPLRDAVLDTGSDIGFAFSGDGASMLAIDSLGRIVNGDQIMYLLGSALRDSGELEGNRIIATEMSNLGFEQAWKLAGGEFMRTNVGDENVRVVMQEFSAGLGGEQNGHILLKRHEYCVDGLLTALQVATLLRSRGQTLADWMDQSYQPYPQKLINVEGLNPVQLSSWKKFSPLAEIKAQAEQALQGRGSVLIRASNTEPLLRIMVQAIEPGLMEFWSQKIENVARKLHDFQA